MGTLFGSRSHRSAHQGLHLLGLLGLTDSEAKSFQLPGAKPHYRPDRPGQVEHLALDLTLDPPAQRLAGTCTIRLRPIRNGIELLELDAIGLSIDQVTVHDQAQRFDRDDGKLYVHLGNPTQADQPLDLVIHYRGEQPQRGIYFVLPDAHYPDKGPQIWTQGEDEDSRFWFPCFDMPGQLATSELRVTVPAPYLAISNGELITKEVQGDRLIYHWRQNEPHPNYLITLAVGDFAEVADQWRDKPVTYYVKKDRLADVQRTLGKTPAMIEFLSERYDFAYPYAKYAQVCVEDFIFGGMENTSTTLLTDRCLLDERAAIDNRNSESLVVHELCHQWFGDLVAIEHWSHAWVKEGMATYSEILWTEHEYGPDEAAYSRLGELRSYLSEDRGRYRRPMVTNVYREAIELYDAHIYEKGCCFYHALRAELGDELFWRAIQTFVRSHAFQAVDTHDLIRVIERSTGRNVQFLFDHYVFGSGHPDYKVNYSWDADHNLAKLTVTQTQAKEDDLDSLFTLKLPVAFGYVSELGGEPAPVESVKSSVESTVSTPETKGAHKGKENKKKNKAAKTLEIPTTSALTTVAATAVNPPSAELSATVDFQTVKLAVREREQSFYFPLDRKPSFISFDVGNHTIKTVELDYPLAELKNQLRYDPDPLSRIFAAEAIARKGGLEALNALAAALTGDRFWGVRAEVAEALAGLALDGGLAALQPGLSDPEARVRLAVVGAIARLKTPAAYELLEPIARDGDASYRVEAAALSALGQIAAAEPSLTDRALAQLAESLETRAGWNEVVRSGAIAGLSQLKTSPAALEQVLAQTALGVPQALRLAAIRALGRISTAQEPPQVERIVARLQELSRESFFLTQVAVVAGLGAMETAKAIAPLQSLAEQAADGRVRRLAEEAIKRVQGSIGPTKALDGLRDELDRLKKDNQNLRSRLEALEAQKP